MSHTIHSTSIVHPSGEIGSVERAFHTLRSATLVEPALGQLDSDDSPGVSDLVQFIRTSARGFALIRN